MPFSVQLEFSELHLGNISTTVDQNGQVSVGTVTTLACTSNTLMIQQWEEAHRGDSSSGTIRRCSRSTLHTHPHTHTHIHIHIHTHIHTLSTRSALPSPFSPFIPQDPALRVEIISSGPETGSQLKQHAFWWAWQRKKHRLAGVTEVMTRGPRQPAESKHRE